MKRSAELSYPDDGKCDTPQEILDEDCGLSEHGTSTVEFKKTRQLEHFEDADQVLCSPLHRCLLSAHAAYPGHIITVDPRLREINHGCRGRQAVRELLQAIVPQERVEDFDLGAVPEAPILPRAEEGIAALERLREVLLEVQARRAAQLPRNVKPTVLVFHADCIRAITGRHADSQCVDAQCKLKSKEDIHARSTVACKGKAVPFPREWGSVQGWPINFKPYAVELSASFLAECADLDGNIDIDGSHRPSHGQSAGGVPWVQPGRGLVLVRHAESQLNVLDREERRRKKKAKRHRTVNR